MTKRVLVAYASVSGSTGEVAEAIGNVLAEHGAVVQVQHVREITSVAGFEAAIVGSSIRAGRWLPEAQRFVEDFVDPLSHIPVAYFTTCLTMVDNTEDSRRTVLTYMEPLLRRVPEITPLGLGLFAGALDPARQQMYALRTPLSPHGDYRDWAAIKGWAAEIAPLLVGEKTRAEGPVIARDAVLSATDLSGADLSGVDLQGADLSEADLSEANLANANLNETDLMKADLAKADLQDASLREAGLNWAAMNLAELHNADLRSANMIGADLHGANLKWANLSQATLNGANLSRALLNGADLSNADLNWANLSSADLQDANLSGANLGWADLSGANLAGANLENTRYNHFTKWPDDFSAQEHGAVLVGFGLQ